MLTAVLRTMDFQTVCELPLNLEHFPNMIELERSAGPRLPPTVRQFFRTGAAERKGFYVEGTSYRAKDPTA